jgi:hypothetical protein
VSPSRTIHDCALSRRRAGPEQKPVEDWTIRCSRGARDCNGATGVSPSLDTKKTRDAPEGYTVKYKEVAGTTGRSRHLSHGQYLAHVEVTYFLSTITFCVYAIPLVVGYNCASGTEAKQMASTI